MYFVCAIKSEVRNYIYVGMTSNLNKRINAHNKGYERTTKPYGPFKLIYTENYANRLKAKEREKYFKSGKGKEFLKTIGG